MTPLTHNVIADVAEKPRDGGYRTAPRNRVTAMTCFPVDAMFDHSNTIKLTKSWGATGSHRWRTPGNFRPRPAFIETA